MEREKREYRADELKLKRLRAQFALTVEQFCGKSGLDKATARKLFKGTPVTLTTLSIAAKVFGITDHLELLHPDELVALGVDPAVTASGETVQEWQVEARLTAWEKTANGRSHAGGVENPTLDRAAVTSFTDSPAGNPSTTARPAGHSYPTFADTNGAAGHASFASVVFPDPDGPTTRPTFQSHPSSGRSTSHADSLRSAGGMSNNPDSCRTRADFSTGDDRRTESFTR